MTSEMLPTEMLPTRLPPASDRLLTTCFLAALFHGIVILGVTFRSPGGAGPEAPALEVVLVNDRVPAAAANPGARYISQRTQLGSGSAANERTLIPQSSAMPVDQSGSPGGLGDAGRPGGPDAGDEQLLATSAPAARILYFAASAPADTPAKPQQLLENAPNLGMSPNDEGIELRLRGASKHQLWVAADTRESAVAVYLDSWRRKIERVGTLNFPDAARRDKLSGTPVIEVTIAADGTLEQTVIRRSSGHAEIDEAAMRILRLAAPYDPFPMVLSAKHDEIRIAYEWQFLGGAPQGLDVLYSDPNSAGGTP